MRIEWKLNIIGELAMLGFAFYVGLESRGPCSGRLEIVGLVRNMDSIVVDVVFLFHDFFRR
jgi:hypothetical protein